MQNLINIEISMTSKEIADLVGAREDNVKRTIERLASSGVISNPPMEDGIKSANGVIPKHYVFSGEKGKRDSIIVVAQLSPEFTARLVDRWQELENRKHYLPQMSQAELIAAMAQINVEQEKRLNCVEQKIEQMEQGTIPVGFQGYSYLKATYGLSDAKSRQLVMAWAVPNKKVPHVAPSGQVTQMSVVHEDAFKQSLYQMMNEAEQRGTQWYHPKMGRFTISGWENVA